MANLRKTAEVIMEDAATFNPGYNLTQLAEYAACELGKDEWLDDPEHWIWDLAIEAYEKVNGPIL